MTTRANFLEDAINSLSVALKNSPVNQGKKALAKAQAGAYDEAATRAKIEQYIKDNSVSNRKNSTLSLQPHSGSVLALQLGDNPRFIFQ